MHYYQFNIGDYMSHTKGLQPFEDLAYRRLLDECYLHESPLPASVDEVARQICMPDHQKEVEYVLGKFFTETPKGYVNCRAQKEIKKYKANRKKKSDAGKLSGKARRSKALRGETGDQQMLNTCSTNGELNIKQETVNKKQETVTNNTRRQAAKKITLSEHISFAKESGIKAIPEDHRVFKYADEVGLPLDYLRLAWRKFVDYYADGQGHKKTYADWPTTFSNNVKNNYSKLWWINDNGEYQLTTAGKQAEKEFLNHE